MRIVSSSAIAVFATIILDPVPAAAQSFDCAKARLPTEIAICNSVRLSRLDEEMASLYFGLPHYVREDVKRSQRRWLRRRNACRYDRQCIAREYRRRIGVLSSY
jgi:uncharacterized protein